MVAVAVVVVVAVLASWTGILNRIPTPAQAKGVEQLVLSDTVLVERADAATVFFQDRGDEKI